MLRLLYLIISILKQNCFKDVIHVYNTILNRDWYFLIVLTNVNSRSDFHTCFKKHVPLRINFIKRYHDWYNSVLIKTINSKAKMHDIFKNSGKLFY